MKIFLVRNPMRRVLLQIHSRVQNWVEIKNSFRYFMSDSSKPKAFWVNVAMTGTFSALSPLEKAFRRRKRM